MYSLKNLDVFLGDHNKKFICRRCLGSYTSENMLIKHKPKCENIDTTSIKTSMNLIFIGRNIFIKIHNFLGFMQISKLIMKKIIHV